MTNQSKRVVVTGIGIVNASGIGKDEFWNNVTEGKSGIRTISRFDPTGFPTQVAGEITNFNAADFIPKRLIIKTDTFTHYALGASDLALKDANLDLEQEDSYRVGVWFGNNAGGWDIAERGFYELYHDGPNMVNAWQATAWFPTAAQGYVTIRYGIRGYSKSFVCDRASGASGLYYGIKSIQQGHNDIVLAGGSEAPISRFGMTCYYETGEVSAAANPETAYMPFDKNRSGMVLGEGSAVLVLESEEHAIRRGAKIYGAVTGTFGASSPKTAAIAPASTRSVSWVPHASANTTSTSAGVILARLIASRMHRSNWMPFVGSLSVVILLDTTSP